MSDSLFKEVSFTPHIFQKDILLSDERKFERLLNLLDNLAESGQIIGVFNDWFRFINANISLYDEFDKDEIEEVLKYLNDRQRIIHIANKKCESNDELCWISEALKLNAIRNFEFVFATDSKENIKSIDDLDRQVIRNTQYKGATILPQSKENMEKILAPILAYAEIVKVYDPYFKLYEERFDRKLKKYFIKSVDRYIDALNIISQTSGFQYGKQDSTIIEIHTSVKILEKREDGRKYIFWELLDKYPKKILDFEKKYKHSIKIFIWEDKKENKWHDRWLVTNQCAITLGKGSDISEWTDATWGILDYEQIPNVEKNFIQNRDEFNLIATVDKNKIEKINKSIQCSEPKSDAEIEEKLKKVKDFRRR